VKAGDPLERIEIGHADWSVARVFAALIAGKATRAELEELAALERLAPKLRAKAEAKIG
jgi:MOSC domain-containing protein YiiM